MHSRYMSRCYLSEGREGKILQAPIILGMPHAPKSLSRRAFLGTAGVLLTPPFLQDSGGVSVNDVHSQLNATKVRRVVRPTSVREVESLIRGGRAGRSAFSVCGSRHAMGGQQFGTDTTLLDLRSMNKVRRFDATRGVVEVDAGIEWPALVQFLVERQQHASRAWGIAQKQTGADRLTIGGALSANAHGRGLRMRPFVGDVESFELVDADGRRRVCSRKENRDLFSLAIGGYGLFGVITGVTLRLAPRRKIERNVEVRSVEGLMDAFVQRIGEGFLYGDFQYAIDPRSDGFMRRGVFSCYRPVSDDTPIATGQTELSDSDWAALLHLAHTDGSAAFDRYASYYQSTSGQIYWSDLHQLSTYLDDYHRALDARISGGRATEMITEIYVPRPALTGFFDEVRETFRRNDVRIVYGTVRLIEQDTETFLPWAREPWACTIFNLHVEHTPAGIERSAEAFRGLIDMAIRRGGSYFLTYHRHARREQVEAAYPRFVEFLQQKRKHDPHERFQSDWWRHYRRMFADRLQIA
jgi:FAD/FMN-containing dehydrogenase